MNDMKTLLICGSARSIVATKDHVEEIWSLAQNPVEFSDRLYGFHGEQNATHSWKRSMPNDAILNTGLPLGNTICIMLVNAIVEDRFSEIRILGSLLSVGPEYTKERPLLAVCVWYCRNIARIPCYWEGGPELAKTYMFQ